MSTLKTSHLSNAGKGVNIWKLHQGAMATSELAAIIGSRSSPRDRDREEITSAIETPESSVSASKEPRGISFRVSVLKSGPNESRNPLSSIIFATVGL